MKGTKLTTLRLAAATYFIVAGGPYGLEELIQAGGYAGAALLVIVTPILFSFPTALMVGELASAIPEEGGYYLWVKRALGPFGGFVEAWLSLCASFFDMAIYPTLFVTYLARAVPGADTGAARIGIGIAMIALCTAWNLRGARSVGNASLLLSVALLGPFFVLSILSVTGAPQPDPPPPQGATLGAGLLVAMWNFMGWDNASTFAGEVERPQRTYPRAMAVAVLAVVITYLVPVLAASRTGLDPSQWSTGAWVLVAERAAGPWLGRAVARSCGRGVRVVSVVVCSVLYSLGLLLSFRKLVEIDLLFYGIALLLEFVALVVLRVKEPHLERPFRVPGGMPVAVLLGVGPAVLFVIGLYKELSEEGSHTVAFASAAAALVVGAIVWALRRTPEPQSSR